MTRLGVACFGLARAVSVNDDRVVGLGVFRDVGVDEPASETSCCVGDAHLLVVRGASANVGMRRATVVAATRRVGAVTVDGVDAACGADDHDEWRLTA